MTKPPPEEVRRLLDYDPATGIMTCRVARPRVKAGGVAGCFSVDRWRIKINYMPFSRSVLAWVWMTGEWPTRQIDHRDRNPLNDAWTNLRQATPTQNLANCTRPRTNKSGFKGVRFKQGRWVAQIGTGSRNGIPQNKFLGAFDTPQEAHAVYLRAAADRWGEFATHGDPIAAPEREGRNRRSA